MHIKGPCGCHSPGTDVSKIWKYIKSKYERSEYGNDDEYNKKLEVDEIEFEIEKKPTRMDYIILKGADSNKVKRVVLELDGNPITSDTPYESNGELRCDIFGTITDTIPLDKTSLTKLKLYFKVQENKKDLTDIHFEFPKQIENRILEDKEVYNWIYKSFNRLEAFQIYENRMERTYPDDDGLPYIYFYDTELPTRCINTTELVNILNDIHLIYVQDKCNAENARFLI
jgi:hypothetical protein